MAMDAMPLSDVASRAVAKADQMAAAAESLAAEALEKSDTLFKLSAVDAIELPYRDLSANVVLAAEKLNELYPEDPHEAAADLVETMHRLPLNGYGDDAASQLTGMLSSELVGLAEDLAAVEEAKAIAGDFLDLVAGLPTPDCFSELPSVSDVEAAIADQTWDVGAKYVDIVANSVDTVSSWILSCVDALTGTAVAQLDGMVAGALGQMPDLGFLSSSLSSYPTAANLQAAILDVAWDACGSYLG